MHKSTNIAEVKLRLFRFIDKLPEKRLLQFYDFLNLQDKNIEPDFWDLLSEQEKEDIENGNYKKIDDVLNKY
jgi:hypothetical protein